MKIKKEKFYYLLSESNQDLFDKIENHEILGASNHLDIIGNMFVNIAEKSTQDSLSLIKTVESINALADYYNESRGNASRAIYNGILFMLSGINKDDIETNEELLNIIKSNVTNFDKINEDNLKKIMEYAVNELEDLKNILLYDYSSTVEKTIIELAKNSSKEYNIYISESSAIDGGRPFFLLGEYDNLNIYFFPDAALYYNLKRSDCCLMGAETFYPDGTGFNTIGSDMVGLMCSDLDIPLYFITPLNKLDIRRKYGQKKEAVYVEYKSKYKNTESLSEDFNTAVPELIDVKPEHIYAYICQEGIIPSNQMFQISLDYDKSIRGVNNGSETIK